MTHPEWLGLPEGGAPLDPSWEAPPARPPADFVDRIGICAKRGAERIPPDLWGLVPFRGRAV
eukprot:3678284-Alexandrium_andersonii.AAC.1